MDNKYNVAVWKILTSVKELLYNYSHKKSFHINIEVMTVDGNIHMMNIDNANNNRFKLNKDILIYENSAILLNNIVKIKIKDLYDENLNNLIIEDMKYISTEELKSTYGRNMNKNRRVNEIKTIQDYINQNSKDIKTINFDSISYNPNINLIDDDKTGLVKDIDLDKNSSLRNDSKEMKLAKTMISNQINVLTSLHTSQDNISINPNPIKVTEDIEKTKSKSIINIDKTYLDGVLTNIDKVNNIVNTETIEILEILPINSYVNRNEILEKPLRLDPTGENYIGVVLDDGTFEPLKISSRTFNVLPKESNNVLVNINDCNTSNTVLKDIDCKEEEFLNDINIKYTDKVVKYEEENIKSINDMIKTSSSVINNIINEDDVYVVTEEGLNILNNISEIKHDLDSYSQLNKEIIDRENKKEMMPFKEDIIGSIEVVGNGFILVNNNEDITIYSTDKISSINN